MPARCLTFLLSLSIVQALIPDEDTYVLYQLELPASNRTIVFMTRCIKIPSITRTRANHHLTLLHTSNSFHFHSNHSTCLHVRYQSGMIPTLPLTTGY